MTTGRSLMYGIVLVLAGTLLIGCDNNNDDDGYTLPQGPDLPDSIEDVHQPSIFVMHAESVSAQYIEDDIVRFTLRGLAPEMVRFEDHPAIESQTIPTHEMIVNWIDYRDGIANSAVELSPETKQDINLHITFHDPETDELLSEVVHMKDLAGYLEAPSELVIDGTLGASSSEAPILPGKTYIKATVVVDSVWSMIWYCGGATADIVGALTTCTACPETLVACTACTACARDITLRGPKCTKEFCGEFMPHTPLAECRQWLACTLSNSDKLLPVACGVPK